MEMEINVINISMSKTVYNQFCFMLQLAMGCELTDTGVILENIPVIPFNPDNPGGRSGTTEHEYREKIKEVAYRVLGLYGDPEQASSSYVLGVAYKEYDPKAICAGFYTPLTRALSICGNKQCRYYDYCSHVVTGSKSHDT